MKQSIQRTWKNGLVLDWFSPEKAKKIPLLEHYVGLRWTKVTKGFENHQENLTSIYDLLRVRTPEGKHGPTHLYIEGKYRNRKIMSVKEEVLFIGVFPK